VTQRRRFWLIGWLVIVLTFIGYEMAAVLDHSNDTVPLTQAIRIYVNANLFFAFLGALFLWFVFHMLITYLKPPPTRSGNSRIKKGTDTRGTGKGRPLPPK